MLKEKRTLSSHLLFAFLCALVFSLPSCTIIPDKEITVTQDISAIDLGKSISNNSRKEFSLTMQNSHENTSENSWKTYQVTWCSTPNIRNNLFHYMKPFEKLCSLKGGVLDHLGKEFSINNKSIKTYWAGICTAIQNDIDPIFVVSYGPPELYGDREPDCDAVIHISKPEKMSPLSIKVYEPLEPDNKNWQDFTKNKLGAISGPALLEKFKKLDLIRRDNAHERELEVERILNSKGLMICNINIRMYAITNHRSGKYILGFVNGNTDRLTPLNPNDWYICN